MFYVYLNENKKSPIFADDTATVSTLPLKKIQRGKGFSINTKVQGLEIAVADLITKRELARKTLLNRLISFLSKKFKKVIIWKKVFFKSLRQL